MLKIRHHLIAPRCLFDLFSRHLPIGTSDKKSAPGTTFPIVITAEMGLFLHFFALFAHFRQRPGVGWGA